MSIWKQLDQNTTASRSASHTKESGSTSRESQLSYSKALQNRIERTCRLHLSWIEQVFKRVNETGEFPSQRAQTEEFESESTHQADGPTADTSEKAAPDIYGPFFWEFTVQGRMPLFWASSNIPGVFFLLEIAFQLIKAEQCITIFTGENQSLPQSTVETFSVCINNWLSSLKKLDRRGQYAIRRSSEGDIGRFHLRDQIWIWRALTSVDKLQKRIENRLLLTVKDYGAGKFQSNILNRFTTESPLARQRMANGNSYSKMVALSRTPQENRFLLHARDTALFYDMDPQMAVFAIPDQLEPENPWLATIYAQPYHESDDTAWTKPLQFGLSVLMASKGFRLNNRSAREALYHCREVLFQKSSKNGLFPGLLEQNQDLLSIPEWFAQKPYWRASFELPYILFHCRTQRRSHPKLPTASKPTRTRPNKSNHPQLPFPPLFP